MASVSGLEHNGHDGAATDEKVNEAPAAILTNPDLQRVRVVSVTGALLQRGQLCCHHAQEARFAQHGCAAAAPRHAGALLQRGQLCCINQI
jgi:hypothetical protein